MGNVKTTLEEKNRVINEVIKAFEVKKENEKNGRKQKVYWSERIGLINREKDTDKKYKKACTFNRTFNLGVEVRKTDRFGESKKEVEKKEVVKTPTTEVFKESNEVFIKNINKAENTTVTKDFETALAPTISNNKGVEVLQKAIAKGYNKFKLTTLQMMGVELVEFASKESEKVYYVSGINDFISVYE